MSALFELTCIAETADAQAAYVRELAPMRPYDIAVITFASVRLGTQIDVYISLPSGLEDIGTRPDGWRLPLYVTRRFDDAFKQFDALLQFARRLRHPIDVVLDPRDLGLARVMGEEIDQRMDHYVYHRDSMFEYVSVHVHEPNDPYMHRSPRCCSDWAQIGNGPVGRRPTLAQCAAFAMHSEASALCVMNERPKIDRLEGRLGPWHVVHQISPHHVVIGGVDGHQREVTAALRYISDSVDDYHFLGRDDTFYGKLTGERGRLSITPGWSHKAPYRWYYWHRTILDFVIAFAATPLPVYVLLWIVDWLPVALKHAEHRKVRLIESIVRSIRSVRERRNKDAIE